MDDHGDELTRFEAAFIDHPRVRDGVLVGFLVGFYGGFMWLLTPIPAWIALGSGVLFAAGWLALMELYCWRNGTSMLRSIGDDAVAGVDDDAVAGVGDDPVGDDPVDDAPVDDDPVAAVDDDDVPGTDD